MNTICLVILVLFAVFFGIFALFSLNLIHDNVRTFGGVGFILLGVGCMIGLAFLNKIVFFIVLLSCIFFIVLSSILLGVGKKTKNAELANYDWCDESVFNKARNALTGCAAIMAVISCYTTAEGMKDVVFGGWLGYPASVAVQVTLAFLSLRLLQMILSIQSLDWSLAIKRLVSYALIFVECVYMAISSSFSYAFIATNAYAKARTGNSEEIARTYFVETANRFSIENDRRGKLLYDEMSDLVTKENGLSDAIQSSQSNTNLQLQVDILAKLSCLQLVDDQNGNGIEKEADLDDIDQRAVGSNHNSEINLKSAKSTLVSINNQMAGYANQINTCVKSLKAIAKNTPGALTQKDFQDIETYYGYFYGSSGNVMENNLTGLENSINSIPGTFDVVTSHKAIATANIQQLLQCVSVIKAGLKDATDIITQNNLTQMSSSVTSQGTSLTSAEDILKRINSIQIAAESINTKGKAVSDLNSLLQEISSWTALDTLSVDTLESVRNFCDDLKEYGKYIELKNVLKEYQEDSASKVYIIVPTETDEKIEGNVVYTTESKWKASRNDDFYTLESCIGMFPKELDGNTTLGIDDEISYAVQLQRKLMDDLTDIELAFSYFDSEYAGYRKMAVFSLVMAVFFDFSAFVMGCLLFLADYFTKHQQALTRLGEAEHQDDVLEGTVL